MGRERGAGRLQSNSSLVLVESVSGYGHRQDALVAARRVAVGSQCIWLKPVYL